MHKNTKLTPLIRKSIYFLWTNGNKVAHLAREFHVNRSVIYKILRRGKIGDFSLHNSTNQRFKTINYGLKRINKSENNIRKKLENYIHRYEKEYPGQMIHVDSRCLSRAKRDDRSLKSLCLYVAIDDRSRLLFAKIMRGKNQDVSAEFLENVVKKFPFKIETVLSDNGTEFKGGKIHSFKLTCEKYGIEQKYTRSRRPQTNGKAERVIRTIMDFCKLDDQKRTKEERETILDEFLTYYNFTKPHSALKEGKNLLTPCQVMQKYNLD